MFYKEGTAKECIFRASGGTRFKNFRQPLWRKGGGGTPRYNRSAQKNSGYVSLSTPEFLLTQMINENITHLENVRWLKQNSRKSMCHIDELTCSEVILWVKCYMN